jgi:CheY-like chemotaxis protein
VKHGCFPVKTIDIMRQILVVDDDKDELSFFERAFNKANLPCKLHQAKSGDDMFKFVEQVSPDVIFLDLHLPGKSGIACLKMLRHHQKYDHIPIVIYTQFDKQSFIDDCFKAKANSYIVKPVSPDKLKHVVDKVTSTDRDAEIYPPKESFVVQ